MPRFIFTNQQNASWENSSWPFIVLNVISHLEFISFTDINSHRSLPKLTVSDMMLERKRHRQRFFFSSINPFPPSSSGLLTNGSTHVLFSMKLSFILHDNGSWDQCLLRRKYTVEWLRKLMWRYLIFLSLVNVLWCFDEQIPVEGMSSLHRHHGVLSATLC